MNLRSPLGLVRGLGSAKDGTHHWWMQRLTSIALLPLSLWFLTQLVCMVPADHATVVAWLRSPISATLMLALIIALFYHAQLGMQVVIEDYVHQPWLKVTALVALRLVLALLGLVSAVAVIQVSLGS